MWRVGGIAGQLLRNPRKTIEKRLGRRPSYPRDHPGGTPAAAIAQGQGAPRGAGPLRRGGREDRLGADRRRPPVREDLRNRARGRARGPTRSARRRWRAQATSRRPRPVLAVGRIRREALLAGELDRGLTLALDGVQDPGNVGTILRIADWFGLDRVLLSPGCADLHSPKVIQSSMGSFARVRAVVADLGAALAGRARPGHRLRARGPRRPRPARARRRGDRDRKRGARPLGGVRGARRLLRHHPPQGARRVAQRRGRRRDRVRQPPPRARARRHGGPETTPGARAPRPSPRRSPPSSRARADGVRRGDPADAPRLLAAPQGTPLPSPSSGRPPAVAGPGAWHRFVAYELIQQDPAAAALLDERRLEAARRAAWPPGRQVDCFSVYLSGPAWRAAQRSRTASSTAGRGPPTAGGAAPRS